MKIKGVRRRWSLDLHGIRREGTKEAGFLYRDAGGAEVKAEKTLARIRKLRIPPAWKEVRIARSDSAALQAVGVDKKGRTQYLYHAHFRAQRDEAKFKRVVEFGERLPELRRKVRADLKLPELEKERVLAAIVRLMDQAFFRIGNDKSAKSESTYGLSTVRGEHVKVNGETLAFDYIGKWRKQQSRVVKDAEVAALVRHLKRQAGEELFKFRSHNRLVDVKDHHVNEYIQRKAGQDFTAKDFRTWAGTLLCSIQLGKIGDGKSMTDKKRKVRKAIVATAAELGNTPAVCKSSYICPQLLDAYMEGTSFASLRKTRRGSPVVRSGLSIEEKLLLKFLRETIANRRRHPRAA